MLFISFMDIELIMLKLKFHLLTIGFIFFGGKVMLDLKSSCLFSYNVIFSISQKYSVTNNGEKNYKFCHSLEDCAT